MKNVRSQIPVFLMVVSLLLLAAFLVLFLKKTWQDELETLKKETSYLFINSIRGIEGEFFHRIVFDKKVGLMQGGNLDSFELKLPEKDSINLITFVGEEEKMVSKDTAIRLTMQSEVKHQGEKGVVNMVGSLSMIVAWSGKKSRVDSVQGLLPKAEMLPLIESNFGNAIKNAGLPVEFRVVQIISDSSLNLNTMKTGTYTDAVSGEQFSAELSGYRGYLFRKILPEGLFSIGLFGIVSLAFFVVFKNLRAQQRLTELKNDFIRNMTHELKTPIATVGVAIEAMQDFDALKSPERTHEYLGIAKTELNRLSFLVDKVLRMSLFEATEPALNLETLDLKTLTEEVLGSLKLQFEKAGATVRFQAEGEEFRLEADRLHLAGVIYNLLDNALKYSSGKPEISVRLSAHAGQLTLSVQDNGIGIPAEYRSRILEKFFRVPHGDVHNVKGHGLGLSYVAAVLEKHGGTIEVASEQGQGSCVTFRVPGFRAEPIGSD